MPRKNTREFLKREEEFEQRVLDVARVTRVMAGGKRMKFRVCLAIGDRKGRVGIGIAKGADVTIAVGKAFAKAKKAVITVPLANGTIYHPLEVKYKAARILLKPAKRGTGVKAGGAVRILCELAGIENITSKILGSNNKINNAKATLLAFQGFKAIDKGKVNVEKNAEPKQPGKDDVVKGTNLKDTIKNLINKK
jgi:small subunit ribosomal protein S5